MATINGLITSHVWNRQKRLGSQHQPQLGTRTKTKRQIDLHTPLRTVLAQKVRGHADVDVDARLSWFQGVARVRPNEISGGGDFAWDLCSKTVS